MKKSDAILEEDVLESEETVVTSDKSDEELLSEMEEEEKPILSPRELAMQAIVSNRNKEMGIESKEEVEDNDEEESKKPETKLFKVKVDGTTTEVDYETLIRSYQKDSTASKRLEEASKKIKEAKELEELVIKKQKELQEIEETLKKKKDQPPQKEKSSTPAINFSELAQKLREGDDEEAVKAIEDLYKSLQDKTDVDSTDIKSIVQQAIREEKESLEQEQKLREEQRLKEIVEEAEQKFRDTYSKELESNDFFDLAIMEDTKLQRDPDWESRSLVDRYIEAGKRAKKWLLKSEDSREKGKQTSSGISQPSKRKGVERPLPKPKSTSDIIAAMARARGQ